MELGKACGFVLGQIRAEKKISKHAAAQRSGLSHPHWGKIESGQHWPSYPTLCAICKGLGVKQSAVFSRIADYMEKQEYMKVNDTPLKRVC